MEKKFLKNVLLVTMIAAGGKNMIGPNLWGVIGRTAGSVSDYKYSKAMIAYGKEWTFEEMNSYLIKPQAHIKGTKMAFAGLRKEKDRASVILYMNSKSIVQNHYLNLNTTLLYFFEHELYLRACLQTTDCFPSITSSVTSSPLPTGNNA
jgi:cytochrome c2